MRARLAHRGLVVSGKRVPRLMRQEGLLAPRRLGPPNSDPAHAGRIIADRPDVMWGTDATRSERIGASAKATRLGQREVGADSHR